jgi:hypothetical protein
VLFSAIALRAGVVSAVNAQQKTGGPSVPDYNDLNPDLLRDCHNDQMKRGSVSFDHFDFGKAGQGRRAGRKDDPEAAGGHDAAAGQRSAEPG